MNRFRMHREMRELPSCPACKHPILPGDMTEPAFTLEHGESLVHWDCAHGGENTAQDATDYSEYNADKGVRRSA
jgi:RNase P subunit RPR2